MKKVLFISAVFILMNSCSATVETNTIEKKVFVCPSCYKEYDNLQSVLECCKTAKEENPADDVNPKNIVISGKNFGKTEFVTVIPKGSSATILRQNEYDAGGKDISDVFYNGRKVTLSHYSMCKYEVTNELYEYVMEKLPLPDLENRYSTERQKYRPAAGINWFEAVIFCNKLSELTGRDPVYSISNISYAYKGKPNEYVKSATVTWDFSKNGYRLPTEAEWEYAARGAGRTDMDWKFRFAGSDNVKLVGWTSVNSAGKEDSDYVLKTHEVGLKLANAIGIYDMSGNVSEWCMDYFRSVTENGDYSHGNRVNDKGAPSTDPCIGKGKYDNIVIRGGCYKEDTGYASLWQRIGKPKYAGHGYMDSETYQGIRLVKRD